MKNKAKWLLLFIPLLFVVLTMVIALVNIFQRSIYDDNGFTLKYLESGCNPAALYQSVI